MDRVRESVRESVRDTRHLVMADGNVGGNRMLTLLVLLVGLISLANLIVLCVMVDRPVQPDIYLSPTINTIASPLTEKIAEQVHEALMNITHPPGSSSSSRRRRAVEMNGAVDTENIAYLIQYGQKAASLLQDGEDLHNGYIINLIREVCQSAGITCLPVYDDDVNCLKEIEGQHPVGGQGLLGGWYDACLGFSPSEETHHIFSFSDSRGPALMARKDSQLLSLWNNGVRNIKTKGRGSPCKTGDVNCLLTEEL